METDRMIEGLIGAPQYSIPQPEKEAAMLRIMRCQLKSMKDRNSHLHSMYTKLSSEPDKFDSLAAVPFIPVQMFKYFDLATCKKAEITRLLKSSATTGQQPSSVPLDKTTARRQSAALTATLASFLGKKRLPFLVMDTKSSNRNATDLSARGMAIRGLSMFAKSVTYGMTERNDSSEPDFAVLSDFARENRGKEVLIFGFTFILWSGFLKRLKETDGAPDFSFGKAHIFHSGGWKKLRHAQVSESRFTQDIASAFGASPTDVHNFYGMAEQPGVVFIDCEAGSKHVANFADVIIRDFQTLEAQPPGKPGLIEVLSVLPDSYPGQALLTEDVGELKGVDDCSCGRKGKHLIFRHRVEKAEVRGCGDITAGKAESGAGLKPEAKI